MLLNRRNEDLHRKAIYARALPRAPSRALPRPPAPRAHQVTTPVRPPSSISGPATATAPATKANILLPFRERGEGKGVFFNGLGAEPTWRHSRARPAIYKVGELSKM